MKSLTDGDLGRWKRAVVTSDGVFIKNGSFIIKNNFTEGLLWHGHKCIHANDMVDEDLYEGTAKSTPHLQLTRF